MKFTNEKWKQNFLPGNQVVQYSPNMGEMFAERVYLFKQKEKGSDQVFVWLIFEHQFSFKRQVENVKQNLVVEVYNLFLQETTTKFLCKAGQDHSSFLCGPHVC